MSRYTARYAFYRAVVPLLVWLVAALALPGQVSANEPARAGDVIFSSGAVTLHRHGSTSAAKKGTAIHEGDRLVTEAESHAVLRMIDGAFISLRSDSALSVEAYRYRPGTPAQSRALLTLHYGAARSVSGELSARYPAGFQLKTPIAAIGVRGTDFSVMSAEDVSRVSLREGAVVMQPVSSACSQQASCGAETLSAERPDLLLETRRGETLSRLVESVYGPDQFRPPHPREDELVLAKQMQGPGSDGEEVPELVGVESYEDALQRVDRYLDDRLLVNEAYEIGERYPDVQPRDRGLIEQPSITWGRWSAYNSDETQAINRLLHGEENRRYAAESSPVFALIESVPESRSLPDAGKAAFQLNRYEAYIKRGSQLEQAAISHPGLVVDFERQRFAAYLEVNAASLPGSLPVAGEGNLLDSGHLRSDADAPSSFEGVLGKGANEAGLLFSSPISPGVDAVGATHWARESE